MDHLRLEKSATLHPDGTLEHHDGRPSDLERFNELARTAADLCQEGGPRTAFYCLQRAMMIADECSVRAHRRRVAHTKNHKHESADRAMDNAWAWHLRWLWARRCCECVNELQQQDPEND